MHLANKARNPIHPDVLVYAYSQSGFARSTSKDAPILAEETCELIDDFQHYIWIDHWLYL